MKHLKKLSVVLMMTTLFSVTFTSCIDNEVSPLVEAIYGAQADLIAAQAGVQNAEAALLLAQANAEQANANYTAALTAQEAAYTAGIIADNAFEAAQRAQFLLQLVAETNVAVAAAQHDLATAQVQFNIDMAALTAQMQAAGAQLAVGYAYDYMYAMNVVNSLKSDKANKQGQLALAELYLKAGSPETTWTLYLAGLNTTLAAEQAKLAAAQAAIVTLNTAKANPSARETQIAGLKAQKKTLETRKGELVALIALAEQNRLDAQKAITDATAFMTASTGTYATAKGLLTTWKANYTADSLDIKVQTANVTTYTNAIANYAGTTTTLTNAKNAAVAAVGQTATTPWTGLKGDIKTLDEITLGTYPSPGPAYGNSPKAPIAPATVLTAQEKLWNADLALLTFEQDFAGLTASYNAAANALVTATNNYNTTGWPALITSAQTAQTTAQGNLTTAIAYYDAKKAIFEANPTGDTWFDQTTPLGGSVSESSPAFPNTRVGIHTDAIATSYAYVTAWVEAPVGTWTATTLSVGMVTAVPGTASIYSGSVASATMPSVLATTGYYVELEGDDLSESNVALFNDASTKLGVEVTAPFYTGTTTRTYAADIASPTSYQALWNAAKLVSETQYLSTNSAALLLAAQEKYDYQKGLFEAGLATRATLEAAVAAQLVVIGKTSLEAPTTTPASGLKGQLETLKAQLGTTAFGGVAVATDVARTTATGTLGSDYYMVGAVKTLTAYAVKWNAELALAKHLATTLAQYQTMLANAQAALTTATREAAEDLIFIAKYAADLAAIQAQYDALILTPLYAALNVTLVNATQAKAALVAEDAAATISISSLTTLIAALQTTVPDYTALIAAENLKITNANAAILAAQIAISKGGVDLAGLQANVQLLKDQIATLTIRIANAQAIADKYKALMTAALAS